MITTPQPLAYLHTLWFSGPEEFPITGFVLYDRKPYPGYNLANGDVLDAAILRTFNPLIKAESVNRQVMASQFDLDYAVNSITTLCNDLHPTYIELRPKGLTKENYAETSFHGQTLKLTLLIMNPVKGEEFNYYTSIDPVYLDHESLDDLWDTISFH